MQGKLLNAIYNGYSFQPLYLGHTYATSFQHLYDFEPHWKNHVVPHYGVFARFYFGRLIKGTAGQDEKYASFKKTYGPPYYQFNPRIAPVEFDSFLQRRGIPASTVNTFEPKVRTISAHPDTHALH
jgi:hypothetical protein